MTKDNVVEKAPDDWTGEQEIIAKDALAVLVRHYPGYKWGVEWTPNTGGGHGMLVVRLLDVPTQTVYCIQYKDIDRDNMRCCVRAGGMMLESHGLVVGSAKKSGERVKGLKRTASGLIVPDYAAVPEHNPGYATIKKESDYSAIKHMSGP